MLKDISKKLTMKKTFFATQLESFFNSITQEYQEYILQMELEKKVLQEKNDRLQNDVNNLVNIKKDFEKKQILDEKQIQTLQQEISKLQQNSSDNSSQELENENIKLKQKIEMLQNNTQDIKEIETLKKKITQLQGILTKGGSAYSTNINDQNKEKIIKEISESLKS
jgi:chromosome segregation ATPase